MGWDPAVGIGFLKHPHADNISFSYLLNRSRRWVMMKSIFTNHFVVKMCRHHYDTRLWLVDSNFQMWSTKWTNVIIHPRWPIVPPNLSWGTIIDNSPPLVRRRTAWKWSNSIMTSSVISGRVRVLFDALLILLMGEVFFRRILLIILAGLTGYNPLRTVCILSQKITNYSFVVTSSVI